MCSLSIPLISSLLTRFNGDPINFGELMDCTRGGGHLNVTRRGGAHFLRVSTIRLGKTFAF